MSNMWKADFEIDNNIKLPKEIVLEQCNELARITDKKILGIVKPYDGPTKSSYSLNLLSTIIKDSNIDAQSYNVQKDLGEIAKESSFCYEFYITSHNTPKYKYRIMFFTHSISIYPLEITLEESIAKEITLHEDDFIFNVNNEKELLIFLEQILNTETVTDVIKNLLLLNKND